MLLKPLRRWGRTRTRPGGRAHALPLLCVRLAESVQTTDAGGSSNELYGNWQWLQGHYGQFATQGRQGDMGA